jgi:hypothetical protein
MKYYYTIRYKLNDAEYQEKIENPVRLSFYRNDSRWSEQCLFDGIIDSDGTMDEVRQEIYSSLGISDINNSAIAKSPQQAKTNESDFLLRIEKINIEKIGWHYEMFSEKTCHRCGAVYVRKLAEESSSRFCSADCKERDRKEWELKYQERKEEEFVPSYEWVREWSGVVYCITNKNTQQKYIGQTSRLAIDRWSEHMRNWLSDPKQWVFEILENGVRDSSKLLEMETKYIVDMNTLKPNGYNSVLSKKLDKLNTKE